MSRRNNNLRNPLIRKERRERLRNLLIDAYKAMADFTAPLCGKCRGYQYSPNRCCDKMHCQMTIATAKEEWGVDLSTTDHPELPLMGPTGCTAAPHYRPLCTLHNCDINNMGFTLNSEWDKQYFILRAAINKLHLQLSRLPS
jgi:hypothetical protein